MKNLKRVSDKVFSGTHREDVCGYCRAIRSGNTIFVSGTTATDGDKVIGVNNAYAQTIFILQKIVSSIESLGGTKNSIVQTSIYIADEDLAEKVSEAHNVELSGVYPANSMLVGGIIGDKYLVEISAIAVIEK